MFTFTFVPSRVPFAHALDAARLDREAPILVERNRENARIVVEDRLGPVAVVRVDVHDRDPLEAELVPSRSSDDGAVVEDAEAVAGITPGVVPGPAQQRMGRVPTGDDGIERGQGRARAQEREIVRMLVHRRVASASVPPPASDTSCIRWTCSSEWTRRTSSTRAFRGSRIVAASSMPARPEQIPRPGDPCRRVDVDVVFDEPADREVETGPAAVVDRELLTPADR